MRRMPGALRPVPAGQLASGTAPRRGRARTGFLAGLMPLLRVRRFDAGLSDRQQVGGPLFTNPMPRTPLSVAEILIRPQGPPRHVEGGGGGAGPGPARVARRRDLVCFFAAAPAGLTPLPEAEAESQTPGCPLAPGPGTARRRGLATCP